MRNGFQNRLIHGTNYFLPRLAEMGVLTVHDVSVYRYPETHPPERIKAFDDGFMDSLARAHQVITDSETVRSELISDMGVAPDKVTAIHLGVSRTFRVLDNGARAPVVRMLLGNHANSYILCVATFEPAPNELNRLSWHMPNSAKAPIASACTGGRAWRAE